MRCLYPFALALLPSFVLSAPALKNQPAQQTIVGEWLRIDQQQAGKAIADQTAHYQKFKADGTWEYYYGATNNSAKGMTFKTDSKQNPPTFDILLKQDGPAAYRGIYKVERDTLTLCLANGNDERPKTFEPLPGKPVTVWVFKRVKTAN